MSVTLLKSFALVPVAEAGWLRALLLVIGLLAVAACALAHLPGRFPGPLLHSERAGRRSRLLRLGSSLGLALGAAACVAAFDLAAPVRRSGVAFLADRADGSSEAPGGSLRLPCPREAALALRPRVDGLLETCRRAGAAAWTSGTPAERRELRRLVLEALRGGRPLPDGPRGAARQLPDWVVDSVELTLVQSLLRLEGALEVHVTAPSGPRRRAAWHALRDSVTGDASTLIVVEPSKPAENEGLRVEHIVSAELIVTPGGGALLRSLAMVVGAGRAGEEVAVDLVHHGQVVARLTRRVQDQLAARVIELRCTDAAALAPIAAALRAGEPVTVTTGRVTARVTVAQQQASARLVVRSESTAPDAAGWSSLLWVSTAPELACLREELAATMLPFVVPVAPGSAHDAVLFESADGYVAVARTEAVARRALNGCRRIPRPLPAPRPPCERVADVRRAPRTASSFAALAVAFDAEPETALALDGFEPVVTVWPGAGQPARPIVLEGEVDGERVVVLERGLARVNLPRQATGGVTEIDTAYDPAGFVALARLLAWAVACTSTPGAGGASLRDQETARGGPSGAPLLSSEDLARLEHERLAPRTLAALLAIAVYLAHVVVRTVRTGRAA